ncbi:MAG TPA: hypothetical protein VGJ05_08165 [Fimbriiglobus sp.]|jgi:membrane protein implicated in regulation of membrane protease activity
METLFLVVAALGGTVLVLQILAGVVGLGGDHDPGADHGDVDHGGNWFLGALGVRTVAAALSFFGLGGLTAGYYGANEPTAFAAAVGSAAAAFYAVAFLMRSLHRLKADGTVRIERTVGRPGTVYLRIPAGRTGPGKIHLAIQNRTAEFQAVTAGPELPTGAAVRVVAVLSADTLEVETA